MKSKEVNIIKIMINYKYKIQSIQLKLDGFLGFMQLRQFNV